MKSQGSASSSKNSPKYVFVGVLVIALTLAALIVPFTVASVNYENTKKQQANLRDAQSASIEQANYLEDAYRTYDESWKEADTDGDGGLSCNDGANAITTGYCDMAISCMRLKIVKILLRTTGISVNRRLINTLRGWSQNRVKVSSVSVVPVAQ